MAIQPDDYADDREGDERGSRPRPGLRFETVRSPRPSSGPVAPRSRSQGHRHGPLGDARGLTAAGCAVLLLGFGFIGALLDLLVGHDLWVMFGIGFIGAAALSAARAHTEDLGATIVLPPLIYFVIAFIFTVISPRSGTHSGGSRQFAIDLGGELVFSAPILLVATLVALALAIARGRHNATRRRHGYQRPSARVSPR